MKWSKLRNKRNRLKRSILILGILLIIASIFPVGIYIYFVSGLPSLNSLHEYNPNIVTKVYSHDGQVIGEFYIERRIVVPFSKISPHLTNAFLAAEDAMFYEHEGVDYWSVLRAFYRNVSAGKIVQGGSTITQQVAKSFFLTPERSFSRKIKEALLAYRIEKSLSKDEILYLYLNQIYLGNGAYGVQAASETYFGKDVENITVAEAALLAALPKAPSRYSPYYYPDIAKQRQEYVLRRMLEEGFITREEHEKAVRYAIKLKPKEIKSLWIGPYFTEHIRRYIDEKYGEDLLYRGGFQVYTSLDVDLQKAANQALSAGLMEYDKRHGYRGPERRLDNKEDIEAFINEKDEELNGKQLEEGKVYQGLVTEINSAKQYVSVAIGSRKAHLLFEDVLWAKLYNPTDNPDGGKHNEITHVIKKNDILNVAVKGLQVDDEGAIPVTLVQEPLVQGSIIALEPQTGYVRAMAGGADFTKSQFNRAIQSRRQPGSAFKPVVYAAALDRGYTPASVIIDSPIIFEETLKDSAAEPDAGTDWKPRNFDEKFHGPTTFRQALTRSRNVVTIKILKDIGTNYVIDYAKKLGIKSPLSNDLSLALGSSGLSLLEITNAYSVFPNMGNRSEPVFITRITDKAGNIIEEKLPSSQPVISPQTAYIITNLLQGVIQEGTGRRAKALGRPAAGKTGTTNNLNDAWFIGFTPDLIAGTWVGYDNEQPLGHMETGGRVALPIWLKFMQKALEGTTLRNFSTPEGVVFTKIDKSTGLPATSSTEHAIFEVFKEGTVPVSPVNIAAGDRTTLSEKFFEMDMGRATEGEEQPLEIPEPEPEEME